MIVVVDHVNDDSRETTLGWRRLVAHHDRQLVTVESLAIERRQSRDESWSERDHEL